MKIRTVITATCATLAVSMARPFSTHYGKAETVTKNFKAAIVADEGATLTTYLE